MIKICPICNNEFETKNINKIWCSMSCMNKSPEHKEKVKQGNLKKYGATTPLGNKQIREKAKQTTLQKYGVENILQSKKVREKLKNVNTYEANEKRKQTMIERYGVDNPSKNKEINEKRKQTCLSKYGVEYSGASKKLIRKREENNLKKYGVKHNFQIDTVREKRKQTFLQKYGVDNPFANKDIQNKIKQSNIKKYGTYNYMQSCITNYKDYNKEYIKAHFIEDGYFLQKDFLRYFNIQGGINSINQIKKRLGIDIPNKIEYQKTQQEIHNFIRSFYNKEIIINSRKVISPLELDIYLPESRLAIEFNGLMYHSYGESDIEMFNNPKEDKAYHLKKTELCESCGIQLLHIFENEWEDKQEIWKSIIKVKLGYADYKINARDCEVREVTTSEQKIFVENNHIQNYTHAKISYGLYYRDELVQVMTFSKSRFNKRYDWELIRECSKLYTIVVGGYSKLLKHFHNNHEGSLISYANRRWSSPLTNKNGLLIKTTEPNYFYFLPNEYILHSRNKFQKHKLKDLLKVFDNNLSESQNMFNNGYRRIYDCGNLLYEI